MDWARIVAADGVELAYTERGAGPPIVVVPGWTMSGEVFEHQLSGLAARFRVLTFDPRSHGRSTVTVAGNSYPQQGRDLLALLDALGLDRVHLVGWSYGALACYLVSAMFSDFRDVARSLDSRLPYANVGPQEFNTRLVRFLQSA